MLPLLAYFTRLTSPVAFGALCLTFALAGIAIVAIRARKLLDGEDALLLLAIVLGHPTLLVILSALGTPDSITFFLQAIILFASSPPAILTAAALGAFNHPVILFGAPAVLVLRRLSGDRRIALLQFLACAIGLAAGTAGVSLFIETNDIQVFGRLDHVLMGSFFTWVAHNLQNLPAALYSLNGVSWLALGACVLTCYRLAPRYYLAVLLTQVLFYGVVFFTIDTTRIFSVMAWPVVAHCVFYSLQITKAEGQSEAGFELRGVLAMIALLAFVAPRFIVVDGRLLGPPVAETYLALKDGLKAILGDA